MPNDSQHQPAQLQQQRDTCWTQRDGGAHPLTGRAPMTAAPQHPDVAPDVASELLAELKQTTFYLLSACLLIEDPAARQKAQAAVDRANTVIAKASGSAA